MIPIERIKVAAGVALGLLVVVYALSEGSSGSVTANEDTAEAVPVPRTAVERSTRCDMGKPSPEEQARWRELRTPSEHEGVRTEELVRSRSLITEMRSRLLDELYTTGFGSMTRAEQNLHLVLELESEVGNGGFDQYFFNTSGNCAARTRTAIAEIGLSELQPLYERALAPFPNATPAEDRGERWQQMENMSEGARDWDAIDRGFYQIRTAETLTQYVRDNLSDFSSPVME